MYKLILVLSLVSLPAYGIVNIEKIGPKKEDAFFGEISLDLSGATGNSDIQSTSLESRFQWNAVSAQFILINYDYEKSSGLLSTDKTFFHYRYINNAKNKMTWESFFQVENDEFKLLKLRTLFGGGLRYTLNNKNEHSLSRLGAGLFYSEEEYEDSANSLDKVSRLNLYYTYQYQVNSSTSISTTTYFQPDINHTSDYRALEQLNLEFKISDDLKYFLGLDFNYDSEPASDLKKDDTRYKSGIKYRF